MYKKRMTRGYWTRGAELVGIPKAAFNPHPARVFFKRNKVPLWAVAEVLGVKKQKLTEYFSGRVEVPLEVEVKLKALVRSVRLKLVEIEAQEARVQAAAEEKAEKVGEASHSSDERKENKKRGPRGIKQYRGDPDVVGGDREVKGLSW